MTALLIAAAGAGICGLIGMVIVWRTPEDSRCTCPPTWPGAAPLRTCEHCARQP